MNRAIALFMLATCGCQRDVPTPQQTGAKEAAVVYFTALASGNATDAFDALDAESRQRVPAEAFERHAKAYVRKVGATVNRVHVQSCEEAGDSATAHVVLIGRAGGHSRRFEDAASLRRRDGKWGIVLPSNFGRG